MEKMRLLNTYVNNVTLDEAVEFLLQKIREQTPAYVVEVNVDVVVKMETDLVLRQITDNADLTLVDGQPLIWISKLYGRPLKMKVSGSDLVPTLLQAAAKEGRKRRRGPQGSRKHQGPLFGSGDGGRTLAQHGI